MKSTYALIAAVMATSVGTQAVAQNSRNTKSAGVEEVTVTATKRKENIQDVPMAVSAFSGATLERLGLTNFTEAARFIPGLQILGSNVNRNSTVLIRGVGTSGTNPGIEPSVGMFMDGVFMPAAGPIQGNLLDIAAIEVLRGPQGTLYGRNTAVGALNITTREPSFEPGGMVRASFGNFNAYGLSGYYGGGITDNMAGRLSLWSAGRDGYQKNVTLGRDANDNEQWGGRGRLKWQANEDLTINVIGYLTRISGHCCIPDTVNPTGVGGVASPGFLAAAAALGRPLVKLTSKDNTVGEGSTGANHTKSYGTSVQADWTAFGGHTLTSISAFNGYDDESPETVATGVPQRPFSNVQSTISETYSQELRLASPKGRLIDYLAGAYFYHQDTSYSQLLSVTTDANRVTAAGRFLPTDNYLFLFSQKTDAQALFGQMTLNISDRLRMIGGMRQGFEDKSGFTSTVLNATASAAFRAQNAANPGINLSRSEDKLTWMGTAQYDLMENVTAYATVSTGWKSGGFNARVSPPGVSLIFGPENSRNHEVGLKTALFDRTVIFNIDAYRQTIKGLQQSLLNPATGSGFIVGNVGNIRNDGIEVDAQWRPIRQLSLTATGAFTDVEIYNYTAGPCPTYPGTLANGTKPGTCSYDGVRPQYTPSVVFSLGGEWRQPLSQGIEGLIGLNGSYQGKQYEDATRDPRSLQRGFTLINARIGVEAENSRWSVAAFGKNLTGEVYYAASSTMPGTAYMSAGGTTAPTGWVGWYGTPRTYGVEATYRF